MSYEREIYGLYAEEDLCRSCGHPIEPVLEGKSSDNICISCYKDEKINQLKEEIIFYKARSKDAENRAKNLSKLICFRHESLARELEETETDCAACKYEGLIK